MFDVTKDNKYVYSYEGLIDSFGVEIVLDEHDDDYQGDSFYLLRDNDRFGYLAFGWGSCSGCDAFEAARDDGNIAVVELRDELWSSVVWFDSLEDLRVYLGDDKSQLRWYGYNSAFKVFRKKLEDL